MAEYYRNRPSVTPTPSASNPDLSITLSEFDKHRESLLTDDAEEGWASELRRYLGTMQRDIKKDSDIVEWWQVSCSFMKILLNSKIKEILGPCSCIPYSRTYCARCSSMSSLIRPMRTVIFGYQTDRY
jgi:hypothetical protein